MKLKWEKDESIKTAVARARGLGSAGEGTDTWMKERITSVFSIPVTLWLLWEFITMESWTHDAFTTWLAQPLNAILMTLTILIVFYHVALGSKVSIEDYVHKEGLKIFTLMMIDLLYLALGVACIFSVLKVAFKG